MVLLAGTKQGVGLDMTGNGAPAWEMTWRWSGGDWEWCFWLEQDTERGRGRPAVVLLAETRDREGL